MKKNTLYIFLILYLLCLFFMASTWSVWHIMSNGRRIPSNISLLIINFAEFPSKVFHFLSNGTDKRRILNKADRLNLESYNYDNGINYKLLVSTFDENDSLQIKLLNTIHFYTFNLFSIHTNDLLKISSKSHKNQIRLSHPILLEDSSLIFSSNSLFRVDNNNSIIWVNRTREFHHSIEIQGSDMIWTSSIRTEKKDKNHLLNNFIDDAICAIDISSGQIKYEKSVADILIENGYKYLLQIGKYEDDVIHLNDIQPVLSNSKFWKKGDLFISIRHRNTIFLYRPSTNKIIWIKTGPWMAQHDVDVVNDSSIMIFGNDVIRGQYGDQLVNGHNDIYFYDFENDSVFTPYTQMMRKLNIATATEGRCDLLPNGDMFIDETNNGKLYIISTDSVKMKYVERIDDSHIKMFNWVRPIFN
jgi:hypothetical protein